MHIIGGPKQHSYRAVILTALPVEFRAVRAHLTDIQEEVHPEGTIYDRGRFSTESGVWEVLLAETSAGNPRAALETERALQHFKPHVALFVGVAGGLKDVVIGDVVFAPKVYGYESGKVVTSFEPRPDVGESSYPLEQRARAEARKETWLQRIPGPAPARPPLALPGPIAAGEKVVAETRSETYRLLRTHYGDALAVEMEGRGFLVATRANRRVDALVIRGISDNLDGKEQADTSGFQELAARHASAFAFELLTRFTPSSAELLLTEHKTEEHGVVWSVPYPRNPNFTGRESLLEKLRAHFLGAPDRPASLALHGLGGVGKTQLALEYAYRHAHDEHHYSHVLWARADDATLLASSYAALTEVLELPERSASEQSQKIAAVRQWLQRNKGWLLIIDNAEQPGALASYLPSSFHGHVLITSRNPAWSQLAKPCPVDVMGPAEAVEFLRKRTGQDEPDAATLLAAALGGLPLALAQAAAYIEQTGKSLMDYLRLFEERHKDLLERPGAPADYPHTVAATWSLSFEQIQAREPAGAALLSLCAFLAPTPIPINLLTAGSEYLPEPLAAAVTDEVRRDEVLGTLRRYSLVQVHHHHLLVHRLVQVVMRDRLSEEKSSWARAALGLVHPFFFFNGYDLRTWSRCSMLLPHAVETAEHAWELETGLELLPGLLAYIGDFWDQQAEYALARDVLEWGLEVIREFPATRDAHEVHLRHRLGVVAVHGGALDEAQEHLEYAMKLAQSFTPEEAQKRATASLLCDLALLDTKRGRLRDARAQAEQALTLLESTVPDNHPTLGQVVSALASILERQAFFVQARVYSERALAISRENFGLLHPQTALNLFQLAEVLEELGSYAEAKTHYYEALDLAAKIYGPEHPVIANMLRRLGGLHSRLGERPQARACCENALRIDEARLGPEHATVGIDLNDVARLLHEEGDLVNARAYLERALVLGERVYGPEHPEVAAALDNLGRVQQEQRELEQARASFQRALVIQERFHGPDHPDVARVLNNLGVLLMHMGDHAQARLHLERALAIDEKTYGPNHHEVAIDLSNLAALLIQQGEKNQGQALLQRALAFYDSHDELPADEVISCTVVVGKVHHERGEWAEARVCLERALQLQEKRKAEVTPRSELLLMLGESLRHLEEYTQAVTCLEQARPLLVDKGENDPLTGLLISLGASYRELDRPDQARVSLEEAQRFAEEAGSLALLSHARFELGKLAGHQEKWQEARTLLEQVWESRNEASVGRPDTVLNELGRVLRAQGDFVGARAHFEEALRLAENNRGSHSWAVATCTGNLGGLLLQQGDLLAARPQLERSLSILEQLHGPSSLKVAEGLQSLAEVKFLLNQFPEAEGDAKRALAIYSTHKGPLSQEFCASLLLLGSIHWRTGALQEAQACTERVLKVLGSGPAPKKYEVAPILLMLADIYTQQDDLPRARATLERALESEKARAHSNPLARCNLHRKLGDLRKLAGDLAGAHACYAAAVELHTSLQEAPPVALAEDHGKLANALRLQEDTPLALKHVNQALELLEQAPQAGFVVLQMVTLRGEILLVMERWQEARACFEQVLQSSMLEHLPPDRMSNLHNNLASSLMSLGTCKRAMLHYERALPFAAKAHGTAHSEYAVILANIGYCLDRQGKSREAISKLKRALAIFEQQPGPAHPYASLIRRDLAGR